MNRNTKKRNQASRVFSLALAAAVIAEISLALTPQPVFAEGEAGVAGILVPKPAEFIPALIVFLVIWFVLAKFAWPQIVQKMEERQKKIQSDLDEAEASKLKSQETLQSSRETIAEAKRQAAQIVAEAKREAERERARILAKAQKDASAVIAKSREAVEHERRATMQELSHSVVDLAVNVAGKLVVSSLDEAAQKDLAKRCLDEMGNLNED